MPAQTKLEQYEAIITALPSVPEDEPDGVLPSTPRDANDLDVLRHNFSSHGRVEDVKALRAHIDNVRHTDNFRFPGNPDRFVDQDIDWWMLCVAAYNGHKDAVSYLLDEISPIPAQVSARLMSEAIEGGLAVLELLHERGMDAAWKAGCPDRVADTLRYLAEKGDTDTYAYLDKVYPGNSAAAHLILAARRDHLPLMQYLAVRHHQQDILDAALMAAAQNNSDNCLRFLCENGVNPRLNDDAPMYAALQKHHWQTVSYLYSQGAEFNGTMSPATAFLFDNIKLWHRRHGDCPPGLHAMNPYHFRRAAFDDVCAMLEKEGYKGSQRHGYAFEAAALFGTTDRVLAYLRRWGQAGKQPLHDIVQNIDTPYQRFDRAAWGDAVLRHGPRMARLVKFAHTVDEPAKDVLGQWSYNGTAALVAKNAYKRGHENPELAALCVMFVWPEEKFEEALTLAQQYEAKTGEKIPAITIDGAEFGKPGYVFRKLSDGDVRGLLLGEFTNCCQHLAGAGSDCARHGFTSENAGFYVVEEQKTGTIVAQSWAWRGRKNELVLDSLESLGAHMNAPRWKSLCREFAKQVRDIPGMGAIHVGAGGATPNLGTLTSPDAQPVDYDGYRDSHTQYVLCTPYSRGLGL